MRVCLSISSLLLVLGCGLADGEVSRSAALDDIFGPFVVGEVTTCTAWKHTRQVEVRYLSTDGGHVPCEVRYHKPTEKPDAGHAVLWHAHNEAGYCERKARWLVYRLKNWGWNCGDPEPIYAESTP